MNPSRKSHQRSDVVAKEVSLLSYFKAKARIQYGKTFPTIITVNMNTFLKCNFVFVSLYIKLLQ
jgi:hypothetical protein